MNPEQVLIAGLIATAVLLVVFSPSGQVAVKAVRGKVSGGDDAARDDFEPKPQGLTSGSTAQDRNLNSLHPLFRAKFDAWLKAARAAGFDVRITETFRTPARQLYLFRQNRPNRWVTSKSGRPGDESMHQFGTAVDIRIERNGVAIWDGGAYSKLYKTVPPAKFGLEPLLGAEWVHLQLAGGYGAVQKLGIKPNVFVGSRGLA